MRNTTILSVLAVALLASTAQAGTAQEPEVTDGTLDAGAANAWGDIEQAWFEQVDAATLRLHLQVALLPEVQPGSAYVVVFTANGTSYFAGVAAAPEAQFEAGGWSDGEGPLDSSETSGSYEVGPHGHMAFDFPLARIRGNASELTGLGARVYDIRPNLAGLPPELMDAADSDATFTLARAEPAARPEGAAAPAPAPVADEDAAPAAVAPQEARADVPLTPLVALLALLVGARARRG